MIDKLRIVLLVIIAVLLAASVYIVFFTDTITTDDGDNEAPIIEDITGNTTGKTGKITTISVTFTDNVEVTTAMLYYKKASATEWSSTSILNGTVDLSVPSDSDDDWYYYITIDDEAGNGPIGDPSTDGSSYYIIDVSVDTTDLVHTVFIEEGTATNCQYCPNVGSILDSLYESGNYNFYYVSLIEDESEQASNRLNNELNNNGNPTVYIDGGFKVIRGGLNEEDVYAEAISVAESRNTPQLKINLTASYENASDSIATSIKVTNFENEEYTGLLRVYVTEKISRWNDYTGSKYHYGFLDYMVNTEIAIQGSNTEEYSAEYDASSVDPENIMIIAVVFNADAQQGYANPPDGNPFDAYYADQCAATEVIEGGNLPPEVGITFPQPGQAYIRGRSGPVLNLISNVVNLLRNTSTLKYTWLLGKTTITAYAEDDSSVERVDFYIDGDLVYNDTEAPYEFSPQKLFFKKPLLIPKKYEIMVTAIDDQGKSSSATLEVVAWRAFVY